MWSLLSVLERQPQNSTVDLLWGGFHVTLRILYAYFRILLPACLMYRILSAYARKLLHARHLWSAKGKTPGWKKAPKGWHARFSTSRRSDGIKTATGKVPFCCVCSRRVQKYVLVSVFTSKLDACRVLGLLALEVPREPAIQPKTLGYLTQVYVFCNSLGGKPFWPWVASV